MQEPIKTNEYQVSDPAEFSRNMVKVALQSQRLIADFLKTQGMAKPSGGSMDPLNLGQTFIDFLGHAMRDPQHFAQANVKLWQDYLGLWQHTARRKSRLAQCS